MDWDASARRSRDSYGLGGIRKITNLPLQEDIGFHENPKELQQTPATPDGSQHLFTGEVEPTAADYRQRKVQQKLKRKMSFRFSEKRQYTHEE